QRRPLSLAGHGVPAEQRHGDHQQETGRGEEAERREVEPAGGGEVHQPRRAAPLGRAAELERAHQDPGQRQQDHESDHRPPAPGLPYDLDAGRQRSVGAVTGSAGGHGTSLPSAESLAGTTPPVSGFSSSAAPSISARNASSNRWPGPTRSTGMPAPTSAATTSDAGTPLGCTSTPSCRASACWMPGSPRSTPAARSACGVPTSSVPPSAMMDATGPAATRRPWLITTTWVQVCSTSPSRWLDKITVRPAAA